MAVGEAMGVGARHVVELVDDHLLERVTGLAGEPVDRHQPLHRLGPREVVVVDVQPGARKRTIAGHVVFVAVAVDDRVDPHRRPALGDDGDRRVDEHRFAGPAYQQRVARRIRAVRVADEHAHRIGQSSLVVAPVADHRVDATDDHVWGLTPGVISWA